MVLQVKDYGAFRHQPSTAWFVTYILRAPKTPKRKVAREAMGSSASKAREYKCKEQEVRRHTKQRYKRIAGSFSFISRKVQGIIVVQQFLNASPQNCSILCNWSSSWCLQIHTLRHPRVMTKQSDHSKKEKKEREKKKDSH